jgi:hypothetical protein
MHPRKKTKNVSWANININANDNDNDMLQVGIKLAWTLLGLFGFQKSEQLHATERGLFSFLRHH